MFQRGVGGRGGGGLRERRFGAHAQQLNVETLPALKPKISLL